MFVGDFHRKVDGQGRVTIPKRLLYELQEPSVFSVPCTIGIDTHQNQPCIVFVPYTNFEDFDEAPNDFMPQYIRPVSSLVVSISRLVAIYDDGRIRLPTEHLPHLLREESDRRVTFFGLGKVFALRAIEDAS